MTSFDISTLLNFDPPEFLCNNCMRIFNRAEVRDYPFEQDWLRCPICNKHYGNEAEFISIKLNDLIGHSRKLAACASTMYKGLRDKKSPPPLRVLLSAFLVAESFIHLTSYGLNHSFLGALKLISQGVDVRGLVSNVKEDLVKEINDYKDENPRLNLITLSPTNTYRRIEDEIPHQKLIIIDGLLAFAGSANLTLSAWRNAREGLDHIEVITDLGRIQEYHDRLFSRHWYKFNPSSQDYSDEIPF